MGEEKGAEAVKFSAAFFLPVVLLAAVVPTYAMAYRLGWVGSLLPHYETLVLVAVFVWVGSTLLTVGFSAYNEYDAVRRFVRLNRAKGNGAARVIAEWFVKKHTWLLVGSVAELCLWLLALTGPASGEGDNVPTVRGVLFVYLLDIVNLCLCLLAVGSTIATRALTSVARVVGMAHSTEPPPPAAPS